jgi:transcriptional regulator with XRE-family HTH domain
LEEELFMSAGTIILPEKRVRWTPRLIKRLRGKRTLTEFGAMLGASPNTVWRWEAGKSQPGETYAKRLSELAERERFFAEWNLAGSMTMLGDLEGSKAEIAAIFNHSIERSARQLTE